MLTFTSFAPILITETLMKWIQMEKKNRLFPRGSSDLGKKLSRINFLKPDTFEKAVEKKLM